MQIFVKTPNGKYRTLEVNESSTVEDLRAMIQQKEGIPPNLQKLIYGGKLLQDGHKLTQCNITKDSTIDLAFRVACFLSMEIIIQGNNLEHIILEVTKSTTVLDVMVTINKIVGIPVDEQQLCYYSEFLDERCKMIDYDIHNGSILHLLPKIPGEPCYTCIILRRLWDGNKERDMDASEREALGSTPHIGTSKKRKVAMASEPNMSIHLEAPAGDEATSSGQNIA